MKKVFALSALILVSCLVPVLSAQTADDVVHLSRSVIQTERQAIVAANLGLSEAESTVFWPLYREYRSAVEQAIDTRVDMLKRFSESYESLTDDEAMSLLDDHISYQKQVLKVQTTYAKKMKKVLQGKTVARFFQIENKMDAIINYELASDIPLMR